MIISLFQIKNYIPFDVYQTVFDIDYSKLYENGKKILLIDLDNTLITYDQTVIPEDIIAFLKSLQNKGFKVGIISNNNKRRLQLALGDEDFPFVHFAKKPLKCGFRKLLKKLNVAYKKEEVLVIGDQLMTDVLGANRMGFDCILVAPLKKSTEKWYTKLNRFYSRQILKRIKKKDPHTYKKIVSLED